MDATFCAATQATIVFTVVNSSIRVAGEREATAA
jgi:hypothetical protein